MKQGTVSVLVGCHSPVHSVLVLLAWHKLYGKWPRLWEIVCIFLHDVGHWKLDYLDDPDQKAGHWKLGAKIAKRLFGDKGFMLVWGHTRNGAWYTSRLLRPDKYSWLLAPTWWHYWNGWVEPKLVRGPIKEQIAWFRHQVRQSIESGEYRSTHDMYLERCRRGAR